MSNSERVPSVVRLSNRPKYRLSSNLSLFGNLSKVAACMAPYRNVSDVPVLNTRSYWYEVMSLHSTDAVLRCRCPFKNRFSRICIELQAEIHRILAK